MPRAWNEVILAGKIAVCGILAALLAHAGPAPRISVSPAPEISVSPPARVIRRAESRSELALKKADTAFNAARQAYLAGDPAAMISNASQVENCLELALTSLAESDMNPREKPKYFKRAEIQVRSLYRRLEFFQLEMAFNDRPALEKLKARIQQVQDALLSGLMSGSRVVLPPSVSERE